jgi:mRNA-degrading endonuclease RelE of RelBE toxin-antitoxin system
VNYNVIIGETAAESLKDMDGPTAELFVLAMLDLRRDPHNQGPELRGAGHLTDRAHQLGTLNTILYTVDDDTLTVYVAEVLWFV